MKPAKKVSDADIARAIGITPGEVDDTFREWADATVKYLKMFQAAKYKQDPHAPGNNLIDILLWMFTEPERSVTLAMLVRHIKGRGLD